ncbi:MAG TPA: response regulator [Azospirillum sp.]|nr:response regulator [Azospirillum sp.]
MQIMIVEDDAVAALSFETILRFHGHEIVGPFSCPSDVFKALQGGTPDLVLMNIDLKGNASGLDCARVLFKRYGIPVVFISGDAGKAQLGRDVALGYMPKPMSENVMLTGIHAIEELIQGRMPKHIPPGLEVFQRPS